MAEVFFDDRETGFEAKYKLDEETRFKARARRDKLFGFWVAKKLGLPPDGPEAADYARAMIETGQASAGDDGLMSRAEQDLTARGLNADRREMAARLTEFFATAMRQLGLDYPEPLDGDHHL